MSGVRVVHVAAGLLMGAGLVISGMVQPEKVLAFLRVAPGWDPSLMFVMGSALAVTVPVFAWMRRRGRPWLGGGFIHPAKAGIDVRLVGGAAVFGLGWGLAGYCPGPALVAGALGNVAALLFVAAMVAGAWLCDQLT